MQRRILPLIIIMYLDGITTMAADGLFTSLSLGGSDDNTKILLLIGITLIVIVISMEMKLIGRVVRTWFSRFHLHYVILPQRSVSEPLHNTDRTNTAIVVSHLFIHPGSSFLLYKEYLLWNYPLFLMDVSFLLLNPLHTCSAACHTHSLALSIPPPSHTCSQVTSTRGMSIGTTR